MIFRHPRGKHDNPQDPRDRAGFDLCTRAGCGLDTVGVQATTLAMVADVQVLDRSAFEHLHCRTLAAFQRDVTIAEKHRGLGELQQHATSLYLDNLRSAT
jgi:hypothetical protein